jgi:hypothetical protein
MHCTREGAEALAANLDAYWHKRGFPQVRQWVERQPWADGPPPRCVSAAGLWIVRSNLVRGMPPAMPKPTRGARQDAAQRLRWPGSGCRTALLSAVGRV